MNGINLFVTVGILILVLSTHYFYVQTTSKIKYIFNKVFSNNTFIFYVMNPVQKQHVVAFDAFFIPYSISDLSLTPQYNQLDTNQHNKSSNMLLKIILLISKINIPNHVNSFLGKELTHPPHYQNN
ncbi:hypothetical protein DM558_06745 [Entomomonas moraniae]|uniref:Uncharacterized protein n=1 Tax=Entomomonas moraniae TaxID=2213226 RepID=A0A3S9XDU6_9GAMM|nr:hypothetical protein [Entomomonas moraniae]AZS50490.1 hypothetical protein DM558_06745 [Entomomonas moraniae]